jgi:Domain of unknown function (DUF3885)
MTSPLREPVLSLQAAKHALFYNYPGGLRFELSEGGTWLQQFTQALSKVSEICTDIFDGDPILVRLCKRAEHPSPFYYRAVLSQLQVLEIQLPRERTLWLEPIPAAEQWGTALEWYINLVFELPVTAMTNLLWPPLARDFRMIHPQLDCWVYLYHAAKGLVIHPYDDRGMDVVGTNPQELAKLYKKFNHYLLDYDRVVMDLCFAAAQQEPR